MHIDWFETTVRINLAGYYQWPQGMQSNPFWSRWVFDHQLRLCIGGKGWIRLHSGRLPLERGSCQWLRAGWDYAIEGDPDCPLEFLTVRFDLLDAEGKPRLGSAELPPENLQEIDFSYVESEMRRIVDDLLPSNTVRDDVTKRFGSSFPGVHRLRATARLTALLMELDELSYEQK